MTSISDISNGGFSVIINPFGEAYPELGNGEGVGKQYLLTSEMVEYLSIQQDSLLHIAGM